MSRSCESLQRFCAGFVVGIGVLVLASMGPGYWQEFARKIWLHNDSFSPWRVGFKHIFLGAYDFRAIGDATHQQVFQQSQLFWWCIQLVVVFATVWLSQRLKSWEILCVGFIPTFFLVSPTYYYYIMLAVPFLFFCGRLHRVESRVAIAVIFLSSSLAYFMEDAVGRALILFFFLSWASLGVCGLVVINALMCRETAVAPNRVPAEPPVDLTSSWVGSVSRA